MFKLSNIEHRYAGPADTTPSIAIEALEINSSGITAIIGPSGSGKTTLLSLLSGFLHPQVGTVEFDGRALGKRGHKAGDVAFVFQSPMLLGVSSGLVNALQGHVASVRKDKATPGIEGMRALFEKLDLDKNDGALLFKRSKKLSGGEAQRFAVARALLTDPKAILCDEPTSSLDEKNANLVMDTLSSWSQTTGRPIVWVTHSLVDAARYAENYVFLRDGERIMPTKAQQDVLAGTDLKARLEVLQAIAHEDLRCLPNEALNVTQGEPVSVSKGKYSGWIANGLSVELDRISKRGMEAREGQSYAPRNLRALNAAFTKKEPRRLGPVRRVLGSVMIYSQHLLTLVVTLLSLQVMLALFFGGLVSTYAATNLEDPSIARISFEYDDTYVIQGQPKAKPLDNLVLDEIVDEVKAKLEGKPDIDPAELDLARVQAYGRWDREISSIRLRGGTGGCQRYAEVQPIFLDLDDPLLNQTVLRSVEGSEGTAEARLAHIIRKAIAARDTPDDTTMYGIIMKPHAENIERGCKMDFNGAEPILADFALVEGLKPTPSTLTLAGVAASAPPMHPFIPEVILFTHDLQDIKAADARNTSDDTFQRANLYFPIQGFETAREVLHARSYFMADDSQAAVKQLTEISSYARQLPPVLAAASWALLQLTLFLIVRSILTLNRRVVAVFRAHGMKFRHLTLAIVRHLLPGLLYGVLLMAVIGALLTRGVAKLVASEISSGEVWGIFTRTLGQTLALSTLLFLGSVAIIVLLDWWKTRQRLAEYLKE